MRINKQSCQGSKPLAWLLSSLLIAWSGSAIAQHEMYTQLDPELARANLLQSGETQDLLKPGEFEWFAAAAEPSDAPVTIIISLRDQRAHVYRDGELIAISTVSTGRRGMETPTGVYPILQKKKVHFSNLYDDAPMPYMQRLTWSGVAMHAGRLPGQPASHGCVRLPAEFARRLYEVTEHGQLVVVSEDGSVDALARAGLDQHLALVLGASSSIDDVMDRINIEPEGGGEDVVTRVLVEHSQGPSHSSFSP